MGCAPLLLALLLGASPGGHAIGPGYERLFSAVMPARPGELPQGWGLQGLAVPQTRVVGLYGPSDQPAPGSCEEAPVCVELVHPSLAAAGGTVAGHFVVRGRSADKEAGHERLVAAIAARLNEAGGADPWKAIKRRLPPPPAPPTPAETSAVTPGDREAAFRGLIAGDPFLLDRLVRLELEPARVRYVLRDNRGGEAVVELQARSPRHSHPSEVTQSFFIRGVGAIPDPPDLVARVHRAVSGADRGALSLAPQDVMSTGERPPLHQFLIGASALALLLLLLGFPVLGRAAFRELGRSPVLWGLIGVGILLRFALPYRLVEMGIGYQLTRLTEVLTLPRYGAGTTTLHHLVSLVFAADAPTMIATHRVLGALTVPLAAAAGVAVARAWSFSPSRWLAPVWAGSLSLSPLLIRSDVSESNLVPVLLGLWAAILAWESLSGYRRWLITLAGLLLVGLSRPEMAVIGPGIWVALCRPWRDLRSAVPVVVGLALVIPWQLLFVRRVVDWELEEKSLHLTKGLSLDRLLDVVGNNALFDARVVPFAVPLLGLWALWRLRDRLGAVLVLLVGGLLWLYVYAVDLSAASQPRLHLVVTLPWGLAGALAISRELEERRWVGWSMVVVWVVSCLVTLPTLWAPTNEDTREELYLQVRSAMPTEGGYVLALLSPDDAPDEPGHYTHRHAPITRFRDGSIIALGGIQRALSDAVEGRPIYYYQGPGCYAQIRRGRLGGRGLLPTCAAVHRHFRLEPVWEQAVVNHGNPVHQELGYYSHVGSLRDRLADGQGRLGLYWYDAPEERFAVGLWRVTGRLEHTP